MKIGDNLPSFTAKTDDGTTVTETTFQNGKYVFYFYPKDDTPGCTKEACDFRDSFDAYGQAGITVIGISKDGGVSHQKFKDKYKLPFTLITDETADLCKKFEIWGEKSFMGKIFIGINRATFLIIDGQIKHVWHNVKVNGHVDDVLKIAKGFM